MIDRIADKRNTKCYLTDRRIRSSSMLAALQPTWKRVCIRMHSMTVPRVGPGVFVWCVKDALRYARKVILRIE